MEAIAHFFQERNMDVLLIQEPPLTLTRWARSIEGLILYVSFSQRLLTTILVRITLFSSAIEVLGDRICGVTVKTNLGGLCFLSFHINHLSGEGLDQFSQGLHCSSSASKFTLVSMDSNAHSPLWSPIHVKLDKVGGQVESIFEESISWFRIFPTPHPHSRGIEANTRGSTWLLLHRHLHSGFWVGRYAHHWMLLQIISSSKPYLASLQIGWEFNKCQIGTTPIGYNSVGYCNAC